VSAQIIAASGPIEPIVQEILRPFGEIKVAKDISAEALLSLLSTAVAAILRGDGKLTAEGIASAPFLKVVGRSGVGYDNIDVAAATKRGIPVVYTPGANARAVAEAAIAWMLALTKRIAFWDSQLKRGNWSSRNDLRGGDLAEATLGIIGFGRIGQQLACLAQPFDMQILACDPCPQQEIASRLNTKFVELDELLRKADFVSLHATATEDNRGLINRDRLAILKRGAYLINLGRGSLVESLDVLHEALGTGRLGGVALDAFDPEPPDVSHPIFSHPNCLVAPHSMALTQSAMTMVFKSMATDMAAILSGKAPKYVVNPEVLSSTFAR
jgi:D-3-phosphoglycerate dehydrogenase